MSESANLNTATNDSEIKRDKSAPKINISTQVSNVAGGQVTGLEVGKVLGDLTVESTINHIENKIVQGDVVNHTVIVNNILPLNDPAAFALLVGRLVEMLGANQQQAGGLPQHLDQQIKEVFAAQQEVTAHGLPTSPLTFKGLGMMAMMRRDYDQALSFLHQAVALDPEYTSVFFSIGWLHEFRARHWLFAGNLAAAKQELQKALEAAQQTDPLDSFELTLRGFIAQTQAQVARAQGKEETAQDYEQKAREVFAHALHETPGNYLAQLGAANIEQRQGNLDAAIAAYEEIVRTVPALLQAHHDLAQAYEDKGNTDAARAGEWYQKALAEWRFFYLRAPNDPAFGSEEILKTGQHLWELEEKCSQLEARTKQS